jgi:hypothetical protein
MLLCTVTMALLLNGREITSSDMVPVSNGTEFGQLVSMRFLSATELME